jgi:mitochondrial pyruvate carrier 2
MSASTSKLAAFWNHPAGPKTIHFWAPTFKWGITIANIADFQRPAELVSYPQQIAVTATGLIWSRFSTQITPVNYNLLTVNAFMAATGIYQLYRKITCDMEKKVGSEKVATS